MPGTPLTEAPKRKAFEVSSVPSSLGTPPCRQAARKNATRPATCGAMSARSDSRAVRSSAVQLLIESHSWTSLAGPYAGNISIQCCKTGK